MFTSDNGFFFGEHRIVSGKGRFYEPAIRVPLVIRGPGIPQGETRSSMSANIDLAPTILDLAGAKPLRTIDGESLVPLFGGDATTMRVASCSTRVVPSLPTADCEPSGIRVLRISRGRAPLLDLRRPHATQNRHGDSGLASVEAHLAAHSRL